MENQELRKAGLKVTAPRVKILQLLESVQDRHMSADEIHRRLVESGEDVGLATIYRVLAQFESAGLIIRHNFEGDHCVYELDRGDHHDHIVCVKCGRVEEFVDDVIETQQSKVAQRLGFKMTDHSLNIYGVCSDCQ